MSNHYCVKSGRTMFAWHAVVGLGAIGHDDPLLDEGELMKPSRVPALRPGVHTCCLQFFLVSLVGTVVATSQVGAQQRDPFTMFGSPSATDLADAIALAHAAVGNSTAIHCRPADSSNVMARLQGGKCDVGLVIESLAARSPHALHESVQTFPLAQYVVGVVVNTSNPVRSLRAEQLGAVFSGKSRSWSELDRAGSARAIELYSPVLQLTQSYIFQHNTMRNQWFSIELHDRNADPQRQKRFPDAIVGAVIEDAGAIGFFQLPPEMVLDKRVRLLQVASDEHAPAVPPSIASVADGTYPIIDRLTLYLHPHAPPEACAFCEFATGPEGAKIIRQFGLWPEYELEKVRGEQRVADVKAGKGDPVAVCDLAGVGEAIKAAALEFARAKMAVQVTLDAAGGSVEQAGERLKTGEAELMLVDGGVEETWRGPVMEEGGAEMVLGSRTVGVVVHPGNSFDELTMDDLRQILAGKVDRWPGATGTAEKIVLYALPATNPLMQLMDRAMGSDMKRAKVTVRPDSERVILSVAAQPGSLGLVDLTKVARHETKVKLLAILPPGETEAAAPAPDRVPEGYPLASPVALHLSPKASEAAKSFFAFLNEGGGRDSLLVGGLIPRPLPEAIEAEVAAAYGLVDESQAAGPPAQVAAAKEDDSPATAAPDPLQDVLCGALGGPAGASPSGVAPAVAPARTDQTAASAAAESTPLDPNRPTPRHAEKTEAIQPAPGEGSVPRGDGP